MKSFTERDSSVSRNTTTNFCLYRLSRIFLADGGLVQIRGFGRRFGMGEVYVQSTSTDKKNLFVSSPPLSIYN